MYQSVAREKKKYNCNFRHWRRFFNEQIWRKPMPL